nr:PaaX family transcriptional regulator C-terminal domain-containing protein [Mycolicibacterium sp. lyk4-40-TYG-92]
MSSARTTPTRLLLAFLGAFVLDRPGREYIHARVIIDVLGSLAINEGAARVTLNRMVNNGLLDRSKAGRTMSYGLTEHAIDELRRGRQRVTAPDPFNKAAKGEWTLLSYSVPESRRDLRHRLRSQLQWSGFGRIRDGLWIAPGAVDVDPVLEMLAVDGTVAFAFAGRPVDEGMSKAVVAEAWNLAALREHHDTFIARWSDSTAGPKDPLAAHTAMVADWLELLRNDPGLPADLLPSNWPAPRSSAVYRAAAEHQFRHADRQLDAMIEKALRHK